MAAPLLVMLAGPNGAGKSTFYEANLKSLGLPFLNADILAREIGVDAYEAARAIASIRDGCIERGESFITETVFSDPVGEKVEVLAGAGARGLDVTLIYIGIESSDLSRERVRTRVAAGGHDVPPEKLEARYRRSLDNLERAIQRLPRVLLYDNSSFASPYQFLAEFRDGSCSRCGEGECPGWADRFVT
ncbi:MAG: AAA family ATPase [Verrucomicrobiales bacterium]|nr:AAA family ATPase [Verrucomicrobiales bacterium]